VRSEVVVAEVDRSPVLALTGPALLDVRTDAKRV
jgi:hypothetical protein